MRPEVRITCMPCLGGSVTFLLVTCLKKQNLSTALTSAGGCLHLSQPNPHHIPATVSPQAPSPYHTQPHHTPTPSHPNPRHNPAPSQSSPRHNPAPVTPQPHHNPAPVTPQPRHNPAPSQPSPRHTPTPSQPSPRHTPTPSQPSPVTPQPRHNPAPSQPSPRHTPTPSQPSPRHTPTPSHPHLHYCSYIATCCRCFRPLRCGTDRSCTWLLQCQVCGSGGPEELGCGTCGQLDSGGGGPGRNQ